MRVYYIAAILVLICGLQVNAQTFDDLVVGAQYRVGDTFLSNGVAISLDALSSTYQNGSCSITSRGYAGGSGNEAWTGNVMLHFDFGTVTGLSLLFGNYGGYTKVEVNGDTQQIYNILDLDGIQIGGVSASVTQSAPSGNVHGCLTLSGSIASFAIGGQEFAIDNVTAVPEPPTILSLLTMCCSAAGIPILCRKFI